MKLRTHCLCVLVLGSWCLGVDSRAQSSRPGRGPVPYADALGTGTTFRVWAPNASSIEVFGDFNAWAGGDSLVLETNGYWSADIEGAGHGDEFKYYINGSVWRQDPRSRQVAGQNAVVYDPSRFDWGAGSFSQPAKEDLVIYELHPGTFYDPSPGDYSPAHLTDIAAKLDYLADLGVNAIELMPVTEFPGERSWGYNPVDIFAVETVYGGPDKLKTLIKACHDRGIAVYHDIVHNHYDAQNSECDLWEFDGWAGGAPNYGGIYFYQENGKCCTIWGRRPHFGRQGVIDFITDNVRMWLDEYRFDGFRWDSPINMKFYNGSTFNPEGYSLVRGINQMIQSNYPGRLSMGEDQYMDLLFDSEWHDSFHYNVISELTRTQDVDRNMWSLVADNVIGDNGVGHARVVYTETHDKVGVLNNAVRLVKKIDAANPAGFKARRLAALGAVLTMTSPGIPLLFQGQEWMEDDAFDDWEALDWDQAADSLRPRLLFRRLIHLRRNLYGTTAGLQGTGYDPYHVDDSSKVLAFHRFDAGGTNDDVVVAANFSSNTVSSYALTFPRIGTWHEQFNSSWKLYGNDYSNIVNGPVTAAADWASAAITLAPYSAVIFSRSPAPPGDADGDGLMDSWETSNSLNAADAGDVLLDPDGDGLTNRREFELGTDPQQFNALSLYDLMYLTGNLNNWDPDNEPMRLTTHYTWETMRLVSRNTVDFKFIADGSWSTAWGETNQADTLLPLSGTAELGGGEPPIHIADNLASALVHFVFVETNLAYGAQVMPASDADGDGMYDAWEVFFGLDTNSAADALLDPDGDTFSNLDEFRNGSDPGRFTEFLHDYNSMACAGTFNNWSLSRAPMKLWENYGWQAIIRLVNETSVAFKFAGNSNWAFNWGENSQGATTLPLDQYGDWQGGNIVVSDTMNGVYRFRFNQVSVGYQVEELPPKDADMDGMHDDWEILHGLDTNDVSDAADDPDEDDLSNLVEFEFGSDPRHFDSTRANFSAISLAGSFNDWSPTSTWLSLVEHFTWQGDLVFTNTGTIEFKFTADGGWTDNWGENNQPGSAVPIAGIAEAAGGNITCQVDRVGTYRFTFNDRTHQYAVAYVFEAGHASVTIPASFNGWDPTAYPMQLVDHYTWELDLTLLAITNSEFKFVADSDWNQNWGENDQPTFMLPLSGTAEGFGGNIGILQVLDGRYRFRFYEDSRDYAVTLLEPNDADGDGLPDAWEILHGLSPTNPADAASSLDADGVSNLDEYLADTDPSDAGSFLALQDLQQMPGGSSFLVHWQGGSNAWQYLQACGNPAGPWMTIYTNQPPTAGFAGFTNLLSGTQACYRIMASPYGP